MSHFHEPHVTREQLGGLVWRPGPQGLKKIALALGVLGMLVFLVGVFTGQQRAWQAFQFNWNFFWFFSMAGVVFAAVQRIVTARWSRSIIRLLEAMVAWLPIAFVLLLVMLFFGLDHVFPWATHAPATHAKAVWLAKGFLIPRDIVMVGALTALGLWFVYTSVRLDVNVVPEGGAGWAKGLRDRMRRGWREERRELHSTHSIQGKIAVAMAICFGFFQPALSWDLSMSADVHFQSTMYGWQVFMGGWVAMLMFFSMLVRWWRDYLGAEELITETQFHDIGKLCFAFTAFWGYLTFSQYLVIWYGNWAEETHFFNLRLSGPWKWLTVGYFVLAFVIPFFGLMGRYPKLWRPTMFLFAACSILGIWIHRYIELYPSIYGEIGHLPFGLWEVALFAGFAGLWGWSYLSFLDGFPKMRVFMMTSPYRDEVQVPVDPRTMEPLPAHE